MSNCFHPHRSLLSRSRVLVCDVLKLFQAVPTTAHMRTIKLAEVAAARAVVAQRVSWAALFLKAYGTVCSRHPELCQSWRDWPFSHVFQHAQPVATVAVHRVYQGENWLLWGKIPAIDRCSLLEIQANLDRFTSGNVETVFRQQLQLSMVPQPLRRLIWWWNLNVSGEKRAKRLGTFLLTTLAGRGAEIPHPPGFLTSTLTYGPTDEDGSTRVSLVYDHRLMDGAFIAERLAELEEELTGNVLAELQGLVGDRSSTNRAA